MKLEEVVLKQPSSRKSPQIPTVITWKGEKMIRNHSIRATIKEILQLSKSLDVVRVGIIGNQGTGKTTLAKTLSHLIHKISLEKNNIPYAVKIFNRHNLLNFEETLRGLSPTNYILLFDDVSFLGANANKKQIEIIKQSITEIRHLEGGQDVKIILILNWHYTLGLDKYLRQTDFRYFTSVGSSELDNMEKIVGSKYMPRIYDFQKKCNRALLKNKFQFKLGEKFFTYSYREPFILSLFYNNDSLRFVVSPTREWIDPICSICTSSTNTTVKSDINANELQKELSDKFGYRIARSAIKLKLFLNGINTYPKSVKQCLTFLDRYLEAKTVSFEELALSHGLKDEKTRLDEKIN